MSPKTKAPPPWTTSFCTDITDKTYKQIHTLRVAGVGKINEIVAAAVDMYYNFLKAKEDDSEKLSG